MGGRRRGVGQLNPAQAAAAYNAATTAAQGLQGQAGQYGGQSSALFNLLFGAPSRQGSLAGGTLSQFLNPANLNVDRPTGPYGLQYQRATQDIAQQFQNQRGALARYLANRGFGTDSPAGFGADLYRRLAQGQADTQGQAFTDYTGKAYEDALRNFWGASSLAAGQTDAARAAALGAQSDAANTYGRLYGVAGQPAGYSGNALGAGLRAGGLITAAAIACPAAGSLILMADGAEKPVEELRRGDRLTGVDGGEEILLADPESSDTQPCVELVLDNELIARSSESHTLLRKGGGYVRAGEAHGAIVKTVRGPAQVVAVRKIPPVHREGSPRAVEVFRLRLDRSHTYRWDGIWSEE